MTSTLYLLTNTPIIPEKNFKLENLYDVRMSAKDGVIQINDFQYIKHSLQLSIKIDVSQLDLEFRSSKNVNYIIIKNNSTNAKEVGYFVINKKWVAEHTIQFDLKMDTINSFLDECELSDKTKIIRQHKDRYRQVGERVTSARFENVSALPFSASDIYPSELELYQTMYVVQAQNVEVTLIISLDDMGSLPIYDEPHNTKWVFQFNAEEIPVITEVNRFYLLDSQYHITRQFGESGYGDDDFSYEEFSREIDFHGTTIYASESEKYVAIRITLTMAQPSEFSEWPLHYNMLYADGPWELTPEEEQDCYDAFNRIKNTLYAKGTYKSGQIDTLRFFPVVDRYSENLNPILYGRELGKLYENGYYNQNWYLIYRNQNAPSDSLNNPVDCFCLPEQPVSVVADAQTSSVTYNGASLSQALFPLLNVRSWEDWNPDTMTRGWAVLTGHNNNNCEITITPANPTATSPAIHITMNSADAGCVLFTPLSQNYVGVFSATYGGSPTMYVYGPEDIISISNATKAVQWYGSPAVFADEVDNAPVFPLFNKTGLPTITGSIKDVDRTDSRIIKIIKLPYCPVNSFIGEDNRIYVDATQWQITPFETSVQALKYKNINGATFTRMMEFTDVSKNPYAVIMQPLAFEPTIFMEKSELWETKLFNSEFYQPKIIYDSFGFIFQLELMNPTNELSSFKVKYSVSGSVTSKMLFTFIDYKCTYNEVQDFNNIMYVSRNNECVIYNQQYINYLRTGYNFERESLNIKNDQLAITTGFSQGMAMADSMSHGTMAGGVAGGIMAGGKSLMTFGMKLYTIANDIILSEMQFNKNIVALQRAGTGVISANDVDLMEVYSFNRLIYKVYEVSPRVKKALFDLFYYTGYICGEMGIPDTTSRSRFNYVSAEVIFNKVPNIPEDIIQDIRDLYSNGITFLHKINDEYDFEQKYENWENSILEAYGG